MRRALILAVVTGAIAALSAPGAAAAQYPLRPGDTGPAVQRWQTDLNFWFRNVTPQNRGWMVVDGIYGESTEEATREFQRGQGLAVTGAVDTRTRGELTSVNGRLINTPFTQRGLEWPMRVPSWFWRWARWYLGRSEYRGQARDPAVRPAAPIPIPRWAWRRMNVLNGQPPEARAEAFAVDRIREVFGSRGVESSTVLRSDRDPYWVLVTGTRTEVSPGSWAAWFRLRANRWTGWQLATLAQADPNLRPDSVPCDIRPAYAEPEC